MNKKVKKILFIILLIVLVVVLIIKGAYSKYIDSATGNAEAEIAKWKFLVNDKTEEIETIKLIDTIDKDTLVDGKIAPGTSGSFDLLINAEDSEVGVKYAVDFKNEQNKPTNLKFYNNDLEIDNIEGYEQDFTGVIDADDSNKIRTLTVKWEWPYETGTIEDTINNNDNIDTEDGKKALDYTFDIVVTGIQVMPS